MTREEKILKYKDEAREYANSLKLQFEWQRDHAYCEYLREIEKREHCRIIS